VNGDDSDPEGWAWPYAVLALLLMLAFAVWYAGLGQ